MTSDPAAIATPPRLPALVRFANRGAALLRRMGVELIDLDEASLVREATRTTGLEDFGAEPFFGPLRKLLPSLEEDAQLSLLGRNIVRRELLRLLQNRLTLVRDRQQHPEIAEVEVRRPLVVVGMPRTGSTILHDVLARDPANRAPLTWECMFPSPPPERASFDSDPRIAECEAVFPGVDRLIPGFKAMHPMGALLSQECVVITQHSMFSPIFHNEYRVPSYQDWFDQQGAETWAPVYEFHKRQLQQLQWRCAGERWVLKSGMHLWGLEHLVATYPDACIVQTHRDPLKVATSFASLATLVRSMSSAAVDPAEVAADWTPRLSRVLEHSMQVRDSGVVAPEQVFDMHFPDLLADPMSVVEKIYGHFDMRLSGEAADAMRVFLAENPQGKHGTHRYAPEQYGLDVERERQRFAAYTDRYGIAIEAAGPVRGVVRDL